MQKKVLAIGLMDEQLHGIKYAAKQGLYIIGVDRNISESVKPYIDEYYEIDLKNVEEIISVIKHNKIEFIIPSTIGNLLTTIAKINEYFSLPGVTTKWAQLLVNKDLYNQHLIKQGLFYPNKRIIHSPNYLLISEAIENIGIPCVLKPAKGSGSRGVIVVEQLESLDFSIKYSLDSLLKDEALIVEKFVIGQEFGVDFQVVDGDVEVIAIRKKILTELPYRQEVGYISVQDAKLVCNIKKELITFLGESINDLETLGNADIISNFDDLYFVEMTLRPAGLGIMYNYLPEAIGFNPVEKLIDRLLGKNDKIQFSNNESLCGLFLWDLPAGIVNNIDYGKINNGLIYKLNINIGDTIKTVKQGTDIFPRGYFIINAESEDQLLTFKKEILNAVELT